MANIDYQGVSGLLGSYGHAQMSRRMDQQYNNANQQMNQLLEQFGYGACVTEAKPAPKNLLVLLCP